MTVESVNMNINEIQISTGPQFVMVKAGPAYDNDNILSYYSDCSLPFSCLLFF